MTRSLTIRRLALSAGAITAVAGLLAGASPATATAGVGTVATAGGSDDSEVVRLDLGVSPDLTAAARRTSPEQAVRDYWTPERMAAAQPVDVPDHNARTLRRAAHEVETVPVQRVVGPTSAADPSTTAAPFSNVAGKVFFRLPGQGDFVCSAAAVNGPTKNLVSTAGHCLYEGGPGGATARNWVFMPGYKNQSAPKGAYPGTRAFLTDAWIRNGESARGFNGDFAFVRVAPNQNGKKLVNVVGGNGLTTGGPYPLNLRIFGYPGNIQRGEVQKTCAKKTNRFNAEGFSFRRISGCGFGGGSSGGPWVSGFKAGKDVGQLRGITSFGPPDNAFLGSPYFDSRVTSLYKKASRR